MRSGSSGILAESQIDDIRERSLWVLEHIGVLMEHPRALSLLSAAGAVTQTDSRLVKIPGSLVERALATAPREFPIAGLEPSDGFAAGVDSRPRARPVISLDWIVDYGEKARRAVGLSDLRNWVRVADSMPNLSMVSALYPWDVPLETRDIRAAEAMLALSRKPILMAPYCGSNVRWIARMLDAMPGGRGARVVVFSSCNSPLIYSESQMDALLGAVDEGLPVMVNSSAVTGATAPITLAGTLVVMNAEILAGIVVSQLAKPGAAAIYCGHPVVFDLRSSIASFGHTEAGLLAAALVQLGRSQGLPAASNGLTTDAHVPDPQAIIEKMITGYEAVLSGAALNGGAGSLASVGTASLEQLVIDDDIYGRIFRTCEGIDTSEDALARDVIQAVGPSRHFLDQPHTIKYMRTELRRSGLANRLNNDLWLSQGGHDALDLAAERVRAVLRKTPEPLLEPSVAAELAEIAAAAEQGVA